MEKVEGNNKRHIKMPTRLGDEQSFESIYSLLTPKSGSTELHGPLSFSHWAIVVLLTTALGPMALPQRQLQMDPHGDIHSTELDEYPRRFCVLHYSCSPPRRTYQFAILARIVSTQANASEAQGHAGSFLTERHADIPTTIVVLFSVLR